MTPPNVIVVLTDQLRASALGCYGNEQVDTPTLDEFAADGLRFDRAYSPHPVCTPARGSLQTGQFKFDHRAIGNWVPMDTHPDRPTLARTFRDGGYRTGYIGKWHLDGQTGRGETWGSGDSEGFVPPGPRRCGYDYWQGFNDGHDHHDGHPQFTRTGERYRHRAGEWQPTVQTDLAAEFIEAHREDPFLLCLSWGPPHPPFEAPAGYDDRYDPTALELPPNVPDEVAPDVRSDLAQYYGMIEALDDDFDRLLSTLSAAELGDETIVVFTADHGEMLGAHGQQIGKNQPYEEAANVPLLVRWPGGIEPGRRSDGVVSLVDLYPTLAGACGLPVPDRITGHDHSAHLIGDTPAPTEPVYLESGWRAVRTERYLLRVDEGLEPSELYDLDADPHQRENLVGSADPEVVGTLLSRLIEQAYRANDHEMTARAFRRDSPWGPTLDEGLSAVLNVDYERYGGG